MKVTTRNFQVLVLDEDGIDITSELRGRGLLLADDCAIRHRRGGAEREARQLAIRLRCDYQHNADGES